MRNLLSKHDLRHLDFLEFLVKNKEKWTLLKTITDHLSIPLRTIQSDIQEINTYLAPLSITASPMGIKLILPLNYSERYIYKKILEKSLNFQLIEYIFFHEEQSIKDLSDIFYISESTIKRMIKNINLIFQQESFMIQTNPISLVGDERKITQFMSFYFNEKYFSPEEFLTPIQINLISKLVSETLKKIDKDFNFPNLKRIFTYIYLNCARLSNHHDIPITHKNIFLTDILEDEAFCAEFFEEFQLQLSVSVIQKLFHIFSSDDYLFTMKDLHFLIQSNTKQRKLSEEIKQVLEDISTHFNIPLNSQTADNLLLDLINIINIRNNNCSQLFILYNKRERFLSNLSINYIHVRNMIKNYLMKNISLNFSDFEWNELNYILLTHWNDLYDQFRLIEKPIKLNLIIDTDIEHGHLIKRELETYSRYNIEVEVLKGNLLTQLQNQSADNIILTNIPGIENKTSPVLCFEEFLSPSEWRILDSMIENILSERMRKNSIDIPNS